MIILQVLEEYEAHSFSISKNKYEFLNFFKGWMKLLQEFMN